jgi:hypothetical protein
MQINISSILNQDTEVFPIFNANTCEGGTQNSTNNNNSINGQRTENKEYINDLLPAIAAPLFIQRVVITVDVKNLA